MRYGFLGATALAVTAFAGAALAEVQPQTVAMMAPTETATAAIDDHDFSGFVDHAEDGVCYEIHGAGDGFAGYIIRDNSCDMVM